MAQNAHLQYLPPWSFGDPSTVFRRFHRIQFIHTDNNILQIQKKVVFLQNEKYTIMCTYSISVDDTVLEKVKPVLPDDKAVEAWMQSQIDILLLQLVESLTSKPKARNDMVSYASRIVNIRKVLNQNHEGRSYSPELDVILSMPMLDEADVPEVVSSLLGAGSPVADQDLNAREAYYQYQMEKHQ